MTTSDEAFVRAQLRQKQTFGGAEWGQAASQLEALDRIAQTGWLFLVKVDGLRPESRFTVMLRRFDDADWYRKDGPSLLPMLTEAIDFFINAPPP